MYVKLAEIFFFLYLSFQDAQMMRNRYVVVNIRIKTLGSQLYPYKSKKQFCELCIHEPEGSLAARYAQCHVRASTCMKHCIEIVKGRWTCLRKHRILHYALEVAARIVNAVCVLHNIALRWRLPEPEYFYNKIDELQPINNDQSVQSWNEVRQRIINTYF